jgi:WD40-like Beta Propeller Repeat
MYRVGGLFGTATLTLALVIGALSAVETASASECPNAALRDAAGEALPDCRAYEQASPVDKNGTDVGLLNDAGTPTLPTNRSYVAAADGSAVTYESLAAFPGAQASLLANANLGRRGSSGWTNEALSVPQSPLPGLDYSAFQFFTPDLAESVVRTPPGVSHAAGDTVGARNVYLRDNVAGTYRTLSVRPLRVQSPGDVNYVFAGASTDLKHILFGSNDALTPNAPPPPAPPQNGFDNLYEWVDGQVRLVTILPDGTPASQGGAAGGPIGAPSFTAMSEDGSRIVFGTRDNNPQDGGQIYLRENGRRTVEVSASQRATPDPGGAQPPRFWGASADGSAVFFSSTEALTDNATLHVNSLYRYDVGTGKLTDIGVDVDPSSPGGQGVTGVLAISPDGSQVYFQSTGQYVAGKGVPGEGNLYRWHDGTVSFVVTDEMSISRVFEGGHKTARLTPDGQHLVFMSSRSLTGYDNLDAATGQPVSEVFLYDAPSDRLTCVSCHPSGQRPVGYSALVEPPGREGPANLQRSVSDDGRRVFFDSTDALVPADVNGKLDVYEYEDGAVHLISSGSSNDDSYFADASKTGDDVFFVTRERLVPTDIDDNRDVYDARVGGGFATVESEPCSGDGCRGAPTPPPTVPVPASGSSTGDGNAPEKALSPVSLRIAPLSKSARRQAARTGYVTLAVRVSEGGIVKARASRTVGGRAKTVASVEAHAVRATTVHPRLHLAKSVRTALKRGTKVRLSIRVSFSHLRNAKTMTLELQR